MASNDDLDDFFKKKDRKGQKHKKQSGLLTNNEELLKQLVIVTSATSAFKENPDLDDADDEDPLATTSNHMATTHNITDATDLAHPIISKSQPHSTSANQKSKSNNKFPVHENHQKSNSQSTGLGQQQDEWEDYDEPKADYEDLRLKLTGGNAEHPNHDDEDHDDDDDDDDQNGLPHESADGDEGQATRSQRRRDQTKEKKVWQLDQVKASETNETPTEKVEEAPVAPSTGSSSVYRPPHARGNAAVTVLTGTTQRKTKKEKLNIASTEEFPTLGATSNKK